MRRSISWEDSTRPENPRKNATWISALTFWYTVKVFRLGHQRDLTEEDLTQPLREHKSSFLGDRLSRLWSTEVDRAEGYGELPSLTKVLFKCFAYELLVYGAVLSVMEVGLRLSQPFFLGLLLRYFHPDNAKNQLPLESPMYLKRLFYYWTPDQSPIQKDEAYLYATGVVFVSFINVLVLHPYMMAVMHVGMKMRVACCSLIYRKALRVGYESMGGRTVGNVVNLMSNDVNRFDIAPIFFHYVWIGPVQVVLVSYFMYRQIGISAVIGIMAVMACIPMQAWLGHCVSIVRRKTAVRTDERVRQMNEIITGIGVIKMYAWEHAFTKLIDGLRRSEIRVLRYTAFIRGVIMSFIMFTTRAAIFLSIVSYVVRGHDILPETVFVIVSYYQILRQTMTVYFPQGVAQIAEAAVAISRIRAFLLTDETDVGDPSPIDPLWRTKTTTARYKMARDASPQKAILPKEISITDASAKYGEAICLDQITLKVVPKKLTALIGTVGCGKSNLLHLILGEVIPFEGRVWTNGVVSYASQDPWLFAGSVSQNIIFGQDFDKTRYQEVVKVCALVRDFALLPYGDRTIVGERGVSLSGGQRARINLARAVYRVADIYLLDDPLSAVDPQVGRHLFNQCIRDYLGDKVVVLATHQLQYLKNVEQIVVLDEGRIVACGTYDQMLASGLKFTDLLSEAGPPSDFPENSKVQAILNRISVQTVTTLQMDEKIEEPEEVQELRTLGKVTAKIYKEYFGAAGNWCCTMLVVLLFLGAQLSASACDFFLAEWVQIEGERVATNRRSIFAFVELLTRRECIYIYGGLIALVAVVALTRSFLFFVLCMRASINLHNRMFFSISRATMRFFNTNTSGRILNRFSKDLGAVDEFLPTAMLDTYQIMLNLVGCVLVVGLISAWLLIPTFVCCTLFYSIRAYYLSTSRSVKRLEGITRSPVFAHLNATLQGLTTIRSHGREMTLVEEFDRYQDIHSSAWFLFISTSRAFGYILDVICAVYIGLITFSFFFLPIDEKSYGGEVGLAVTQCIGLTGLFQWGMRQSAELENQMTSVERVLEFTKIEQEPPLETQIGNEPPKNWPQWGKVVFHNVQMWYSESEPPTLTGVSFIVNPKEKIGIVGRTGAGKSSLISALFRLAPVDGQILIDGLDIATLGLHDLRKNISIIPQEPVLFSGTLRYNLDPFGEYKDDVLLSALINVEIKSALQLGSKCLDQEMDEGGANMSVGERQLVCLARAIVRNNVVLVMDEATANVDLQTDRFIQTTLRSKFGHCTVLTIAHRLLTVMDSDKILVMDAGCVVEYDHPYILLQNKHGFFAKMVARIGAETEAKCKQIAKEGYDKKKADGWKQS